MVDHSLKWIVKGCVGQNIVKVTPLRLGVFVQLDDDADVPFREFVKRVNTACQVFDVFQQEARSKCAPRLVLPSMIMTPLGVAEPLLWANAQIDNVEPLDVSEERIRTLVAGVCTSSLTAGCAHLVFKLQILSDARS